MEFDQAPVRAAMSFPSLTQIGIWRRGEVGNDRAMKDDLNG